MPPSPLMRREQCGPQTGTATSPSGLEKHLDQQRLLLPARRTAGH